MTKQFQLWLNKFDFPKIILAKKIWRNIIEKRQQPAMISALLKSDLRSTLSESIITTSFISLADLDFSNLDISTANYLCQKYCTHHFDLLGSGWVSLNYNQKALGVEGNVYESSFSDIDFDFENNWLAKVLPSFYVQESKKLFDIIRKTNKAYNPIDWHRDFKSGFRFDSQQTHATQYGQIKGEGIDIKMPWELGRLQHLPQLALFAAILPDLKNTIITEYVCQMYDFMALNPAGIGVNWSCTMDVGIRAANMLVAYDIFCQLDSGNLIDETFKQHFANYVYSHGYFITNHLEYQEGMGSNHYLSNVAGLLFVASYLQSNEVNDNWWWLSVQEFLFETEKQFFSEGSNFEGSTSYHRLSGELITYCSALVCGLVTLRWHQLQKHSLKQLQKEPFINLKFLSKVKKDFDALYKSGRVEGAIGGNLQMVYKAAMFSKNITKHNGEITQIGDNDSGRFFKFSPCGKMISNHNAQEKYENLKGYLTMYGNGDFWDENNLNHQTYLSATNGIFEQRIFDQSQNLFPFENSLVKSIISKNNQGRKLIFYADFFGQDQTLLNKNHPANLKLDEKNLVHKQSKVFGPYACGDTLFNNLKIITFNEFGLVIVKSDHLFLSIACGTNKNYIHSWGHTHSDKLSIELQVDGVDILLDPGTYIYTPLPNARNAFRAVANHNTLVVNNEEQNWWYDGKKGLFKMMKQTKCEILNISPHEIKIALQYRQIIQIRQLQIGGTKLVVNDASNKPFVSNWNNLFYSNGYGKKITPGN